jgi:hypothetical protein
MRSFHYSLYFPVLWYATPLVLRIITEHDYPLPYTHNQCLTQVMYAAYLSTKTRGMALVSITAPDYPCYTHFHSKVSELTYNGPQYQPTASLNLI